MKASTIKKIKNLRIEDDENFEHIYYSTTDTETRKSPIHVLEFVAFSDEESYSEEYGQPEIEKEVELWLKGWHEGIERHILEISSESVYEVDSDKNKLVAVVKIMQSRVKKVAAKPKAKAPAKPKAKAPAKPKAKAPVKAETNKEA